MTRTSTAYRWIRNGALPLALVTTVACATEPSPRVEAVKAQFASTAGNPVVREHASVEIYEAEQTVERLEKAWKAEREEVEIEHLASLAEQRIEIARVRADAGAYAERLEALGTTRDELRLKARELEARIAQIRASRAEREAAELAEVAAQREEDLAQVAARARELENEVSNLKTRQDARGLVVTLADVLFEFDRADLKPGAERALQRVAEFVGSYPDRDILVEGHTDSVGAEEYNESLSRRRAKAVADFLEREGIDASRIEARGLGESAPVASNDNASGRQENRRVELVLKNRPEESRR